MEIFGNIEIKHVRRYEEIKNFFHNKDIDGVILTINELEDDFLTFKDCCVNQCVKNKKSCINNSSINFIKLNTPDAPYVSYYGNLYESNTDDFVNHGIARYSTVNFDDEIVKKLDEWFSHFFNTKRNMYDVFHAKINDTIGRNILKEIKSIFPFFLALYYRSQWECSKRGCHHAVFFEQTPRLIIKYCDKSQFVIHAKFVPAHVSAYIGCNKPYVLQIEGNSLFYFTTRKNHTPDKLSAAKHNPDINNNEVNTAWNVLHTIAIEIISSDHWRNSNISTEVANQYKLGEFGSVMKFAFTRLKEKNSNEIIDLFLEKKGVHIEYISRIFKLVAESKMENFFKLQGKETIYVGFKSHFHAAEHIYRHYSELRKCIKDAPLHHKSLANYPEFFPNDLSDIDSIERCIHLVLYDAVVQYKEGKLKDDDIKYKEEGGHINTLMAKKVKI